MDRMVADGRRRPEGRPADVRADVLGGPITYPAPGSVCAPCTAVCAPRECAPGSPLRRLVLDPTKDYQRIPRATATAQVYAVSQTSVLDVLRHHKCAPGRNRTCDHWIRSPLLFPLSYGGR